MRLSSTFAFLLVLVLVVCFRDGNCLSIVGSNDGRIPTNGAGVEDMDTDKDTDGVLRIEVYYETLCWDSLTFMNQAVEALNSEKDNDKVSPNSLEDKVQLDLIPYGKAEHSTKPSWSSSSDSTPTTKTDEEFTCQHGVSECDGNRLHACLLKHVRPHLTQLELVRVIACSMDSMIGRYSSKAAALPPEAQEVILLNCLSGTGTFPEFPHLDLHNNSSSSISRMLACNRNRNGTEREREREGDVLLSRHGDRTHALSPKLTFVPWIRFNRVWNQRDMVNSLTNFKSVLCSHLSPAADQLHCL